MSSLPQTEANVRDGAYETAYEPAVDTGQPEQHAYTSRRRSWTRPLPPRPSRTDLERACRIALLEEDGPVSVEVVYDRIVRRGSIMFFGYKRPFRAIASALSALSKSGELTLVAKPHRPGVARHRQGRLWQRTPSKP